MSRYFYAVAQSNGHHHWPDDQPVTFFGNVNDAVAEADALGGNARVFVLTEMSESAHWDWGVDRGGVMQYVSEDAARNCAGGHDVVRRRRGTKTWYSAEAPANLVEVLHDSGSS